MVYGTISRVGDTSYKIGLCGMVLGACVAIAGTVPIIDSSFHGADLGEMQGQNREIVTDLGQYKERDYGSLGLFYTGSGVHGASMLLVFGGIGMQERGRRRERRDFLRELEIEEALI